MILRLRPLAALGLLASAALLVPGEAHACGGCFHQEEPVGGVDTTVVTGHRMAFAFSSTRTVLWDQIQYSGSPADFSWVLPVKGEAVIEAARLAARLTSPS